jgi:hypothetical protein
LNEGATSDTETGLQPHWQGLSGRRASLPTCSSYLGFAAQVKPAVSLLKLRRGRWPTGTIAGRFSNETQVFCAAKRLQARFRASNSSMAHWDPRLPVTSSEEPAWTIEAEETYRDALEALLAHHPVDGPPVPFVVGGAFAIHRHTGIWRTTKDIDFFLAPCDIPAAFQRLEESAFETAVEDPVWLAKAWRGKHFVDLITGVGNASLTVDRSWIDRGLAEIVLGVPCRVLGPEECIASKCFVAFRERFDGADIVHLLKACGRRLDWQRIFHLVGEHWELLYWSLILYAYVYPAHTDAVPEPVWRELTQRFTEQLGQPDRNAPFRGSLVDPRMFAIDVDEWGERNLYQEYCDNHPCLLRVENSVGSEE